MERREFIHRTLAATAGLSGVVLPLTAKANLLRPGNELSLRCLGNVKGPRFLDGRTRDGSVGLAPDLSPRFSGTRWHVFSGGGLILLQCRGDIEGPRWLDGPTATASVGLAPRNTVPFTGTRWRVAQSDASNPDIVALECMGNLPGARWLDGRTGDGSVGLAPNTKPPFTGTRWEVRMYPVTIDQGSEGHPATN